MEPWQKDLINKNLEKLVEYTECNIPLMSLLVANDLITNAEMHDLVSYVI